MSICTNPYSIPVIDINECVGLSLATINSNFQDLKTESCLTYDQLYSINSNLVALSSDFLSLSALTPAIAKAWVSFDATTADAQGIRSMYKSSNVFQVSGNAAGTFKITFTNAFPNASCYAVYGTSSEASVNNTSYTWLQPIESSFQSQSFSINIHSYNNNTTSLVNPPYVYVAVFSN
jgi:hypothetical protein